MLPLKTIPEVKKRKHHTLKPKALKSTSAAAAPPRKKARLTSGSNGTEVEGEDGPHVGPSASASSFQDSYLVPVKVRAVSWLECCANCDHCEKLEEESRLFILRNGRERTRWNTRRQWRCSLSMLPRWSQNLHNQEVDERQP